MMEFPDLIKTTKGEVHEHCARSNPCGITVGIDIAKNIFAVHGVDKNGKAVLIKPKVSRDQLLPLIAQLPPCLIGIEACSGAHHRARLFREYGHTVKLR
jgi:transposase